MVPLPERASEIKPFVLSTVVLKSSSTPSSRTRTSPIVVFVWSTTPDTFAMTADNSIGSLLGMVDPFAASGDWSDPLRMNRYLSPTRPSVSTVAMESSRMSERTLSAI